MINNIKLNYKEGWGDQKCIFGFQTRLLTGRRRRGRRREEGEEDEGEDQAKVWMLDFAMNFVWTLGILA